VSEFAAGALPPTLSSPTMVGRAILHLSMHLTVEPPPSYAWTQAAVRKSAGHGDQAIL